MSRPTYPTSRHTLGLPWDWAKISPRSSALIRNSMDIPYAHVRERQWVPFDTPYDVDTHHFFRDRMFDLSAGVQLQEINLASPHGNIENCLLVQTFDSVPTARHMRGQYRRMCRQRGRKPQMNPRPFVPAGQARSSPSQTLYIKSTESVRTLEPELPGRPQITAFS